jgi:23S rRNA (cytidine1920-2'-O)/16S rRNA (cytidine1409-2'-O)-methyltransferase
VNCAPRGRRADILLVARGLAASRAEAQAAIAAGNVRADGKAVAKPAQRLSETARLDYAPLHSHVSRGALKLIAALDGFAISPKGLVCLDLGASTGGFTEILLERGATKIYAVDVGHAQLHPRLANDPRVVAVEGLNARALNPAHVPEAIDLITADVSFISLKLALPPSLALAKPGAKLVALIKPQFEVGRGRVGKGGIVREARDRQAARDDIATWIASEPGWIVEGTIDSPIEGGDGNREFFVAARKP